MKRNYLLILSTAFAIFGAGFYLSLDASAESSRSNRIRFNLDITDEDRKMAELFDIAYRVVLEGAPEGEGCKTIPYLDLQKICKPLMDEKHDSCHPDGGNPNCGGELGHQLRQAIERNDRAEVRRLHAECKRRMAGVLACAKARQGGAPVWYEARSRVKAAISDFAKKERDATGDDRMFWRRMNQHAGRILTYYQRSIGTHDEELRIANVHVNECRENIRAAERAF